MCAATGRITIGTEQAQRLWGASKGAQRIYLKTRTGFVLAPRLQPSTGSPASNLKSPCRFMMSAVFMVVPQPPVALLLSECM